MKTTLLLFLIALPNLFLAQNATGKVVDQNNEPIPYVTIQVGEYGGTVSNMDGEFSINVEKYKTSDYAAISYLGYKTLELTIEELLKKNLFVLVSNPYAEISITKF